MTVTEDVFLATLDKYLLDVREESIQLFRTGVAHDHVLKIAMHIAEAKAVDRARRLQNLGLINQ